MTAQIPSRISGDILILRVISGHDNTLKTHNNYFWREKILCHDMFYKNTLETTNAIITPTKTAPNDATMGLATLQAVGVKLSASISEIRANEITSSITANTSSTSK